MINFFISFAEEGFEEEELDSDDEDLAGAYGGTGDQQGK